MEKDFRTTELLLRLAESGSLPLQVLLLHRATIAVLQPAYLIYLHAKDYSMSTVKDIPTGLHHHWTEMYENEEAFLAVAYSISRAREAVHFLEEAGGHLDEDSKLYITEDKVEKRTCSSWQGYLGPNYSG
jgi:thiaminase